MKKIYRLLNTYIVFLIIKLINRILINTKFQITPQFSTWKKFKFEYSNLTRRVLMRKENYRFPKIILDTSFYESELCHLGRKFGTNKSGINTVAARSSFTGFYSIFLYKFKDKLINFAEIGIENNFSTKMWRNYFNKAKIYCFDFDNQKILNAKKQKLKDVYYHYIDVNDKEIIRDSFKKINKKFDVIIDDSDHLIDHQVKIIKNVHKYLNKGGLLIIEDIYKNRPGYSETEYYKALSNVKNYFSEIIFFETPHVNNFTASWNNNKILLLVKK